MCFKFFSEDFEKRKGSLGHQESRVDNVEGKHGLDLTIRLVIREWVVGMGVLKGKLLALSLY